jgi:hypothetical protein
VVSVNDVRMLIAEGEGEKVEFKRSAILSNTTQLAIELTAFANTNGGIMLVGVNDDGTYEGMIAQSGHQELVMNVASDRCEPPVRPQFEKVVDGALVYVIQVQKSGMLHGVKFHGGTAFYVRVGSTVRNLHPSELAARSQPDRTQTVTRSPDFARQFSLTLDSLVDSLKSNRSYEETRRLMNESVMLLKARIDDWDEPSVEFGTRELIARLYALSEGEAPELYVIFEDLFGRAYRERKLLLQSMIWTIKGVMMESWAPEHNVEKAEKACRLLLRLGIDFFHKDLTVTELCGSAIDDLASDMYEPEILSKQILLAAYAYGQAKSTKEQVFVDQLAEGIRENDELAWDALYKSYFIDAMGFAFAEKDSCGIDLRGITLQFLYPSISKNINQQVQSFVELLEESVNGDDHSHAVEELVGLILSYESYRPDIAGEIEKAVLNSNAETHQLFNNLIDSSGILRKIYKGSDMITTFDEMISFLETNSDFENVGIGVTAFGVTIIHFSRPLTKSDMQRVVDLTGKYDVSEGVEVDMNNLTFEVDRLVYRDGRNNMTRLIDFLKDLNNIVTIRSIATGITFDLRRSLERGEV